MIRDTLDRQVKEQAMERMKSVQYNKRMDQIMLDNDKRMVE